MLCLRSCSYCFRLAETHTCCLYLSAPDVDLALLEIIDEHREEFFGGNQPNVPAISFATDIPLLQSKVTVCGYPTGGSTICLTEGVVSRVDDRYFGSAQGTLHCLQIDAAINSGNSGGPCYGSDGTCVGVAFAKSSKKNSDNIGCKSSSVLHIVV